MAGKNYLMTMGLGDYSTVATGPTEPTLAVSDDNDGTATATITTSSAAAVNTVYTSTWDGTTGALGTWTSGGFRTGPKRPWNT